MIQQMKHFALVSEMCTDVGARLEESGGEQRIGNRAEERRGEHIRSNKSRGKQKRAIADTSSEQHSAPKSLPDLWTCAKLNHHPSRRQEYVTRTPENVTHRHKSEQPPFAGVHCFRELTCAHKMRKRELATVR